MAALISSLSTDKSCMNNKYVTLTTLKRHTIECSIFSTVCALLSTQQSIKWFLRQNTKNIDRPVINTWFTQISSNAILHCTHPPVHVYWVPLSCELSESWWRVEKCDQAPICRQTSGSCRHPRDLSLRDRELSVHLYATFSSPCSQLTVENTNINHIQKAQ